jgi:hypothetical protein
MKFAVKVSVVANEIQKTEREQGIKEVMNAASERTLVMFVPDFDAIQKFVSDINQLIDTHDQFKEVQ